MRMYSLQLALVLLLLPVDSIACRCEQLPLADYFGQADFVAMAELTSATAVSGRRSLEYALLAAPYRGGVGAHGKGTVLRFTTAMSTAECGIQPEINAVYIVFASSTGEYSEELSVDSCSGTRVHISAELDEPTGFIDVPARFVAGQLNAYFGMEVLRDVSANAPNPSDPGNSKLIGLLAIKTLTQGGSLKAYRAPSSFAPVSKVVHSYEDLESREFAYEQPAAIVYARLPDWYRVRLADGSFGWLSAEDAGSWFPYEQLPVRRLAYLADEWSGLTWPEPGAGIPIRKALAGGDGPHEYPVNVLESVEIGGMPWFRVELLATDPCSGASARPGYGGWIPAYGRHGKPTVWFYSRGC